MKLSKCQINPIKTKNQSKLPNIKKILIVDDSEAIRISLKEILESSSIPCKIIESEDGNEAIQVYKENNPDVVIMDVYMPKTNGIKALQMILQMDKKAKVIMITAAAKSKLVRQSIGIGAKDYILKPFDRIIVSNIVGKVLNQTR